MNSRLTTVIVALAVSAGAVTACDSVMDSPTKPGPALMVQHISAETQLEQIAIRVKQRLRVMQGLDALSDQAASGDAMSEVCVGTDCASEAIVSGEVVNDCDTAVGFGTVEIASAWLDGDRVGIDFCVPITTNAETYRITVRDSQGESNEVETVCGQSGGFLACGPS